jgi:hypothetical protein
MLKCAFATFYGLTCACGPTTTSYLGCPSEKLKKKNEKLLREREDWIFTFPVYFFI